MATSLQKFIAQIKQSRSTSDAFKCKKTRCDLLSKYKILGENGKGVLYWMQRDCRVQDNWALIFAQRLATKAQVPLHVCVFGALAPFHLSERQRLFFLNGLKEVEKELKELNINFFILDASASAANLKKLIETNYISGLICEFFPLKQHKEIIDGLVSEDLEDFPIIQVDAHNIVPCQVTSDKLELAARTIRPKITKKLPEFLHAFVPVIEHDFTLEKPVDLCGLQLFNLDEVENLSDTLKIKPGYTAAVETLHDFINHKLRDYGLFKRNDPSVELQSEMSPYLHFGQISAQRVALEVKSYESVHKQGVICYLEELIIRRELSDNFCYYNPNYDNISGTDKWAQETLKQHEADKREYIYSEEAFIAGETHDEVWNAAQKQLVKTGKMHGYLRMYWAKKILEWTPNPQEAIKIALKLNDTYSLDGCDPNGFVGVMWSICGVHDHGWKERPIFGKIRFMVEHSLRKKFNVEPYLMKYLYQRSPKAKASKRKLKEVKSPSKESGSEEEDEPRNKTKK